MLPHHHKITGDRSFGRSFFGLLVKVVCFHFGNKFRANTCSMRQQWWYTLDERKKIKRNQFLELLRALRGLTSAWIPTAIRVFFFFRQLLTFLFRQTQVFRIVPHNYSFVRRVSLAFVVVNNVLYCRRYWDMRVIKFTSVRVHIQSALRFVCDTHFIGENTKNEFFLCFAEFHNSNSNRNRVLATCFNILSWRSSAEWMPWQCTARTKSNEK